MVKMPYFDVLGNYAGLRSVLVLFHKFKDLKRAIKMMVCSSKASFFTGKVTSSDLFAMGSTALKS